MARSDDGIATAQRTPVRLQRVQVRGCDAAHALVTAQISAVRGDLACPAAHAADLLSKRCSVVLRNCSVVVAQIPHSTHNAT